MSQCRRGLLWYKFKLLPEASRDVFMWLAVP